MAQRARLCRNWHRIYLEEEGDQVDAAISISTFQLLLFTLTLGLIYLVLAVHTMGFPDLTQGAVSLAAISHTGYVGGKVPNKKKRTRCDTMNTMSTMPRRNDQALAPIIFHLRPLGVCTA